MSQNYIATAQTAPGQFVVLNEIPADNDQDAMIKLGPLVRGMADQLPKDCLIGLSREDGTDVCPPSLISEHLVDK